MKLTKIDDTLRRDHQRLAEDDECYFFGEYTPRGGHKHSSTNQLITNLKIEPYKTHKLRYKRKAIQEVARAMAKVGFPNDRITFVPVPPSKAKGDPAYDARMMDVLQEYAVLSSGADFRELVLQKESTEASHKADDGRRLTLDELIANYAIDEDICESVHRNIIVVDDVLTVGVHFKAMKSVLLERFPGRRVQGVFVARREIVPDNPNQ